jgi:two-component system sensor histidine kinase KdpD
MDRNGTGENRRPNPDDLLVQTKKENRGRLTIFLGAAAGVGKTFAMLEAAHERINEGVDLVVGWAETHGRPETGALLQGLPAVPPKNLEYRGHTYQEMDLDALLTRCPALALVDELAHTNVTGSRHVRRFQDVEELLEQGIGVYTTVNIQHIESLNDIVAQITGVRVRETVPDRFLEEADQIHLIDVPPEDLIQRLNEGKVYVPEQAQQALRKFFRPGNINALRELALRFTAQRVDHEMDQYMRLHAIEGPWPAGERIMACISASPFSAHVIRTARRMAAGLKAEWLVAYVEIPDLLRDDEVRRDQLTQNLRLAEELGAEIVRLSGEDIAEELLALSRHRNVTQIVIGKPLHSNLWEIWNRSPVDKIIRGSHGISVHVISGKPKIETGRSRAPAARSRRSPIKSYLWTIAMVFLVTLINRLHSDPVNIVLLYLLPVIISATFLGRGPSILASVLGFLFFDFFFIPPFLSFSVADLRYFVSLAIFLVVSLTTSSLAAKLRDQVEMARQRELRISALYGLSRKIAVETDLEGVLKKAAESVAETIDGKALIFAPDETGKLKTYTADPALESVFNENEWAVARWVFEHGQLAGRGTDTFRGVEWLYLPLMADEKCVGVLGVRPKYFEQHLSPEQHRLLEAFANLTALALVRLTLSQETQHSRNLEQSEKLRTALFNSISHELRTPLAFIQGAVTSLLDDRTSYSREDSQAFLQTIKEGTLRMNRLVENLLDMARLESGALRLKWEWCDIEELVGVALRRLRDSLKDRPLKIQIEQGLPLVKADLTLIEQVLVNILDNAAKHSPPGSKISLYSRREGDSLRVAIADQGAGIPEGDRERIFDKFYRIYSPHQVSGTGLGLSICKGIVEAHGGRIWVETRPGGGSVFVFTLPLNESPPPGVPNGKESGL